MNPTIWKSTVFSVAILLLALYALSGLPLQAQRGGMRTPSASGRDENPDPRDPRKRLEKRMVRESFLEMQKESEKLVEMSTQLRDMLQQASEDELSLDVMKKAEAIEKLGEKIKNRMKNL